MKKSENSKSLSALEAALKRKEEELQKLKAKHKKDMAEIKKLRRRKDIPVDSVSKKKEKTAKVITLTEEQERLLSSLLPGIDILS